MRGDTLRWDDEIQGWIACYMYQDHYKELDERLWEQGLHRGWPGQTKSIMRI